MKWFMLIIGVLSLVASGVMYYMGSHSSHVDELLHFYWYPLPLAAIGLGAFFRMNKKPVE